MGCASSKNQSVCRNCRAPHSPVPRSYSMHVRHPPEQEGDSHHVVALTSTTLGSLKLDPLINNQDHRMNGGDDHHDPGKKKIKEDFSMEMIEAKTWSKMIEEKIPKIIPKTPIRTPPGEPESINAWELMEGLEDISPLRPHQHIRSFSFHVAPNPIPSLPDRDQPTPKVQGNGTQSARLMWLDVAENDSISNSDTNSTSIASEFDPEVISTFRKALEELPPANPFHLMPLASCEEQHQALAGSIERLELAESKKINGGKDRVIVYFTSLRGVRKTYEDCCHVRVILKGLRIRLDERDVSMHSGFKEELKEKLGDGFGGLPRVFFGSNFIGGAEEIRRMHEEGVLEKAVEGCEVANDGDVCETCGDVRFVPCETCSGSCKIYCEGDPDEEYEEEEECGFQRCPDCNENGLVRCPVCCD